MTRLAHPAAGHILAILGLARVEFRSAVRARERVGDLSTVIAGELIGALERHIQGLYLVQPVSDQVVEHASALLDRHPLRAYDAMQLAGCISLQPKLTEMPYFVCADRVLLRAAESEGFKVLDPTDE